MTTKITITGPCRTTSPRIGMLPCTVEFVCVSCRKTHVWTEIDLSPYELNEARASNDWMCESCQADWDEIRFACF